MPVTVNVYGSDVNSSEYESAVELKSILEHSFPKQSFGQIKIFTNLTFYGQKVKDIDILVIGNTNDYQVSLVFPNEKDQIVKSNAYVNSFITTIELKEHPIDRITRKGTDFFVKYKSDKSHNVTDQSNKQKYALKTFIETLKLDAPYITNLIWFKNISKIDLERLLKEGKGTIKSNVFSREFDINIIMQLIANQQTPIFRQGKYFISSAPGGIDSSIVKSIMDSLSKERELPGELTRKKIEQITMESTGKSMITSFGDKMGIYRGNAGAGKTIVLLQTAIKLVDEEDARVLVLTYNRALVTDIRRLLSFIKLPDLFDESCLYVNTMHSYFYNLINYLLYEGKLTYGKFMNNYNQYLINLHEMMVDDDFKQEIRHILNSTTELSFDYILIDEAQDWSTQEQKLVMDLYDEKHIIVADGGNQFVRNIDVCDWGNIRQRNNVKLKYCLRQKDNIIKFINCFSMKINDNFNQIKSSSKMIGGKVFIIENTPQFFSILANEREKLINEGNVDYDILCLTSSDLVKKNDIGNNFSLASEFHKYGYQIWDGTNELVRLNQPIESHQIRVVQYESSRGLEGWIVCCINFDEFIRIKQSQFDIKNLKKDPLVLKSEDDIRKEDLLNWALIPLTRAIDTLIITIKDKNHLISKLLKEISEEYPDFVYWIK